MATIEMEGQVRLGSGKLRVSRASRSRSVSQDLSLERFHSQELIQEQQEGQKHLMQFNAQVVSQPYATLNSGKRIPLIGLGTFKSEDDVMEEAVHAALRAGYRHVDAAHRYGNEHAIGAALNSAFKQGFAKREETFITSKLWNTDHGKDDVRPALLETLKDLHLEYLDLYLIHWPVTEPQVAGDSISPPLSETWAAMEKLVDEGLVRSIGVSNCSIKCIQKLLKTCRIKPAVNQVEVHPFWRNNELIEYCMSEGIHVSAYCPMGTPWTSAKAVIRRAQSVSSHPLIKEIAAKYKKHVLSLLIRWGIQRGTSVLAKSSNPHHIRGNLEGALGWSISAEDMRKISSIEFQLRLVDGIRFLRPEGPYRNMNEMWDDEETEIRRQEFINRMYKFPQNPSFQLNNGAKMPVLGLGTWKDQQVSNTVQRSLRRGFRHVDCSSQSDNEEEIGKVRWQQASLRLVVGKAMAEIFSDWIVNRPDVFVTAKLQIMAASKVEESARSTLKRLQLEYLDLLLLPTENVKPEDLEATWRSMEALVEKKLTRAIGLANASMSLLTTVLGFCSIKPAVNSVEVHPYCRNDRLVQLCRVKGVHVMASSWPATAYMLHKKDAPALLRDPVVQAKASMLGKHPSQLLIRWAIQHGHNVSPKACNDEHIKGILDVLNWELPEEHYLALCRLPQEAPKQNLEDFEPSENEEIQVLQSLALAHDK